MSHKTKPALYLLSSHSTHPSAAVTNAVSKAKDGRYTNADMHFIYGFCNGKALVHAREYQLRYPERRQPDRHVFQATHHNLKETSTLMPEARVDRDRRDVDEEEYVVVAAHGKPSTSKRRIASHTGIPQSTVQRVLHENQMHHLSFTTCTWATATVVYNSVAGYCIQSWMKLTF
jgi:hypothetical protein